MDNGSNHLRSRNVLRNGKEMRYGHEVGEDLLGCTVDRDESMFISFKDEPIGTHVSKESLKSHVDTVGMWLRISTEGK